MKTASPVGLIRVRVRCLQTLAVLALLFCVCARVSFADTQAQSAAKAEKQREKNARREAKKHEVKPHAAAKHPAVKHPDEHPEAKAKEHEAAAKKRRHEDKKRESKAKAQEKKAHPAGLTTRRGPGRSGRGGDSAGGGSGFPPTRSDETATNGAPGHLRPTSQKRGVGHPDGSGPMNEGRENDTARVSRVHAWEESQKKQGAVPTRRDESATDGAPGVAAASPISQNLDVGHPTDSGKDVGHSAEAVPGSEAGAASTGVSNPPPDGPEASVGKQADVVGVIRRPQVEPTEELAGEPMILPALYTKRGRLVVPPPLKGSHEILLRQNQMADDEGLDRIRDDEDLERMRGAGLLVPLPASARVHVDERLPANRRYCRPWAALFLEDMGREFHARFGEALQVNSAVRTVKFQQRLIHTNGNAAPAGGDAASPHLTGQAVDIGKHGMSLKEIAWMRSYLLPLVEAGKVDVEEEFQQSCFHISVYKSYLPRAAGRREVAAVRHGGMSALATGLR